MNEKKNVEYESIPQEKFRFVNDGERISDAKFSDKPIGYLQDAWIRFRKSRASVVAAIIILLIIAYSFVCPLLIRAHDSKFMDAFYAKKPARVEALYDMGVNGSTQRDFSEASVIKAIGIGVGAADTEGLGNVSVAEGLQSDYQPIVKILSTKTTLNANKEEVKNYTAKIDNYLEVGFIYRYFEPAELEAALKWQEETGLQVLYPLVEDNEYNLDAADPNFWYKSKKGTPLVTVNGKLKKQELKSDLVLEDNYKRDAEGNALFYEVTSGTVENPKQYRVRVLYYNYFKFKNGAAPDYILGTDSQGYDMALRLAGGIKLSLLIAVCVSIVNFIIGAMYGAVEGYYGGAVDIILERISDILYDVPFVVVATLFQIHLSAKVGPVPCLIFAYVLTGWIGTAHRVRTQFYRFKNQEYVMAARTLGAKDGRIIWKHIFPNTLGTIITSVALVIPSVITSESMLSYLGIVKLGSAEAISIGTLLADASSIWTNYPHLMICPAVVISLLMICFNLFGNGLRDAFNPALRGTEE